MSTDGQHWRAPFSSDVGTTTTRGWGAEQHWDTQHLRTDRTPKGLPSPSNENPPITPFPLSHPNVFQETPRAQCRVDPGKQGVNELTPKGPSAPNTLLCFPEPSAGQGTPCSSK